MCMSDKLKNFKVCLTQWVPVVITLSSIVTALIPNPTPGTAQTLETVHKVLDIIALNIKNNTPEQKS